MIGQLVNIIIYFIIFYSLGVSYDSRTVPAVPAGPAAMRQLGPLTRVSLLEA